MECLNDEDKARFNKYANKARSLAKEGSFESVQQALVYNEKAYSIYPHEKISQRINKMKVKSVSKETHIEFRFFVAPMGEGVQKIHIVNYVNGSSIQ